MGFKFLNYNSACVNQCEQSFRYANLFDFSNLNINSEAM